MENVVIALITGGLSLLGVIITTLASNKSIENKLVTAQAVTDTKIDMLSEEVRKHNNFATRIPVIEEHIRNIDGRLDDVERDVEQMASQVVKKGGSK